MYVLGWRSVLLHTVAAIRPALNVLVCAGALACPVVASAFALSVVDEPLAARGIVSHDSVCSCALKFGQTFPNPSAADCFRRATRGTCERSC